VLSHLSTTKSSHPGSAVVRTMMDIFDIDGPKGKHQCIVHEPLLTSLLHFQATFNPPRLSEDLVRGAVQQLLFALDFLHTEAHVIHTGILLFLS
jgi:serine/threonine-protein kinase SRPK3